MAGTPFCEDCPDHEACMGGYPCDLVKELHNKAHPPYEDDPLFAWLPQSYSGKIECTVCHASGFPGCTWMEPHKRGHLPCRNGCGKLLTVKQDGTARAHSGPQCIAVKGRIKRVEEHVELLPYKGWGAPSTSSRTERLLPSTVGSDYWIG